MLSKVFGRPLRTMSLCNCYLLCAFSTVYNLSLSVFLPCWRINVFIMSFCMEQNVVTEANLAVISANREGERGACHSYVLQSQHRPHISNKHRRFQNVDIIIKRVVQCITYVYAVNTNNSARWRDVTSGSLPQRGSNSIVLSLNQRTTLEH